MPAPLARYFTKKNVMNIIIVGVYIFFIDLALRLLFIDLHFFIATIQNGVIVQACYTPQARWLSDLFNRVPNSV